MVTGRSNVDETLESCVSASIRIFLICRYMTSVPINLRFN